MAEEEPQPADESPSDGVAVDAGSGAGAGTVAEAGGDGSASTDEFGWRGWLLVGTLAVAFVVVPWMLVLLPEAQGVVGALGLTLRDAYLVLPLAPAFALGAVAVWTAVRYRQQ